MPDPIGDFVDEAAPAADTQPAGDFVDEAPAAGSFVEDPQAVPATDEVTARLENPYYVPSQGEYEVYRQAQADQPWLQPEKIADTVYEAGKGVATQTAHLGRFIGDAISTLVAPGADGTMTPGDIAQTLSEGAARGTLGDIQSLKKLTERATSAAASATLQADTMNFDQFAATKVAQMNAAKFGDTALTPENFNSLIKISDIPAAQLVDWKKEYATQYVPAQHYQDFLSKRKDIVASIEQSSGHADLLPHLFGAPDQSAADASSMVLSPSSLALLGSGGVARTGLSAMDKAAATTALGAGRALSATGKAAAEVAGLPARAMKAAATALSDSPEIGEVAENAAAQGAVPIAPKAKLKVPLLGQVADAMDYLRAGALPVTMAGDAMQAAGRAIESGPGRTGMLAQIASDGSAPKWLRLAAGSGRFADPALSLAGSVAKTAAEGATYGGVIGGATDGEDGALSGIGGGLVMGAGMGALTHLTGNGAAVEAAKQGDLNRWFNSKPIEEQANIAAMNLSADDVLKFAAVEQIARGIRGAAGEGDIHFIYTDDATFQKQFGGSAKGAEFINGDQPTVLINADRADAGTLPHEVFHGLLDLAGTEDAKNELMNKLFSQVAPDGTVLRQGIFSPDDLAKARDQYVSRLSQPLKDQWATFTPEEQAARMRGELASDAFANLVKSQASDYLLKGLSPIRRRLADNIIQAQEGSILGQLRTGLRAAGVTFDGSGAPSELFVKDGKPITNSPQVDAALRDYLRARDKVRSRVSADDDLPSGTVITRQDMMSKDAKAVAEVFKDNDNYAKNSQGDVRFQGGQPILLSEADIRRVQTRRAEAMINQLNSVPAGSDPGAVRRLANDHYEGRYFTDAQLDALDRVPNDILSPSIKQKIRAANEKLKAGDGSRIMVDYNAATKEAKGGGRIYSSSIKSTLRDVVPYKFHISKAKNFYIETADMTNLYAKLNRWFKDRPGIFDPWGGDKDAVVRDIFKYLDNHANGREGSIGLDSGRATAVQKKNVLNDLFGAARGQGVNPIEFSTKSGKDQMVRSLRIDRINRITESGGDKMFFDYAKQKANFLPTATAEPLTGKEFTATTPIGGSPVKGHYEVHEADDLVSSFDKGFDPTLQPRDRTRAASANQIVAIMQKLEPERLGEAPTTDLGAPVIDDQRQVLSGNGRITALRTMYNGARAERYRDFVLRNADRLGLKAEDVAAMQQPVLVRRVEDYGKLSKAEFARQSNQSQLLAMSGGEKAAADARMLTENPAILDKFAPSEDGNVMAASNHDFLNHFIQATGDSAELMSDKGYNENILRKRVETAIMATILGPEHRDLIGKLVERAEKFKIRKAVAGVMQSGAKLIKLKGTAYDLGGHLQEAMANLIRLRGSGEKVQDFLASQPLIGNADRTAAGDHVLEFLANAKSMKQVSEDLGRYHSMARNAIEDAQSGGLFGDQPRTREQIVAEIYGKLQRTSPQYPGQPSQQQPAGQPAPVASQPIPQPAGPSPAPVTVQPVAAAPTTAAPIQTKAPATSVIPPPARAPYSRPGYLSRPMPRSFLPIPTPAMIAPKVSLPAGVTPQSVSRHTEAQTIEDLAQRLAQSGAKLTNNVRASVAAYFVRRLDNELPKSANQSKMDRLAQIARTSAKLSPADIQSISEAIRSKGMNAARGIIDRTAKAIA